MKDSVKQGLWRFGRVTVALVLSYWLSQFMNDPKYLALAPVISGVAKWIRDEIGIDVKVI